VKFLFKYFILFTYTAELRNNRTRVHGCQVQMQFKLLQTTQYTYTQKMLQGRGIDLFSTNKQTNKQISIPRLKSVQQSSLSSDSTIATFCFSVLCLFPPALLWLLWPDHLHRKLTKIVPLQARWAVHISVRDPHNLSMPSSLPSHPFLSQCPFPYG